MTKFIINILALLIVQSTLFGQSKIDSLEQVLPTLNDDSLKIHTYLLLRDQYHRIDQQVALDYAIKAEILAQQAGFTASLAEAKYRKGTVLLSLSLFDQAEFEFNQALELFTKLGDKQNIIIIKIELARLLKNQSRPKEAIALFFEALPMAKKMGNKNLEARIYNYLGETFKLQKQYEKAIEEYMKALELVEELNFKPGISACLINLGSVYIATGDLDKAIDFHKKALVMKDEMGDKLGASRVLSNLGEIYSKKQQFDLAEDYFNKAINLAKEVNNISHQATVEYGIARNALNKGDLDKCIRNANDVLSKLPAVKDLELAVKTHNLLFQAYLKKGNKEEALSHAMIHTQLSDSLYNEKILSVTNELDRKYQSEQRAKEITLLETENNLKNLKILKRESERNYFIAFAAISLLFIGLIYNQFRIKQKANAKLKELDHLKSDFFTNISHEFRTPLSLIMAPLKDRIKTSVDVKDSEEYNMMYRNADHLFNLINQILDLAKLESGKFKVEKVALEVGDFFRIIGASFSSLAEYRNVDFRTEILEQKIVAKLDRDIVQKICYNLLSNAFKFTPEHGLVNFKVNVIDQKLKITISDSGPGITQIDQEKVFDRFFQSTTTNQLGTGIGLALTKELVELHAGKIDLSSSLAKGTTFTISIPVVIVEAAVHLETTMEINNIPAVSFETTLSEEIDHSVDTPVVLIIEDNSDLRNYLEELLHLNYVVHKSENGAEGIKKAMEIIPDLIISDVMMPEKDGIEVCEVLKSTIETNHIPIILLTAKADQESKLKGLIRGADDYLLKPFDPQELRVRVSNLLSQRKKLKEKYIKLLLLKPDEIEVSNAEELFLKMVMEVVNKHMDDSEFDSDQFSVAAGMSRMQLHRKLTALTGHSTMTFVRHQRMVRAAQLLSVGEPVSQVAYAIGFSGVSAFTRAFKKEYGVVPSEYHG